MPNENLPPFLEDEAQRLRVTWRKSVNFFNTFTTQWMELKGRFERGEFDHRRSELAFNSPHLSTFDAWALETGLDSQFIAGLLKAHNMALAEEHRRAVQREIDERRQARLEKKAAAQQAAAEKKLAREQKAAAKGKKPMPVVAAQLEKGRQRQAERRAAERAEIRARGPIHPELRELLSASGWLRQRQPADPVMLGNCYCMMRLIFEQRADIVKAEGRMPNNDLFTWGSWAILHIAESPDPMVRNDMRSVNRMIKQYISSLPQGEKPVLRSREERLLLGAMQSAAA